jgi:NADH:ubiquinone oxidoreductase subunit D
MTGRLVARLDLAHTDMRYAAQAIEDLAMPAEAAVTLEPVHDPERTRRNWLAPGAAEATGTADSPRGRLAIRLRSTGGPGPADVNWERPSAALLTLVPSLLAGQTVADAGLLVASLDLSMAEADG